MRKHPAMHLAIALCTLATAAAARAADAPKHNVILFVADGLRHGAVDTGVMPTFAELRASGVNFVNSHSLFPTVTTPNASAIATGHYLGDTGDFANTLFLGYPGLPSTGRAATHAIESDSSIPDMNDHFGGNYLNEDSLIATARRAGFHTAIIGKLGPALVQDVTLANSDKTPDNMQTIFIDDATGAAAPRNGEHGAMPLPAAFSRRLANDDYFKTNYFRGEVPPGDPRTAPRGANGNAGTKVANTAQQKYLIDVLTRAVLPSFADPAGDKKPFVALYWSRDPDGTQHNELDVPDQLVPGVNGPTVRLAFENVDNNLKQLLEYLRATPDPNDPSKKLSDTTDIFITSDHGFGTISRGQIDMQGTMCDSFASRQRYADTRAGQLPPGFVGIDLAHDLGLPLYDADKVAAANAAPLQYRKLKLEGAGGIGNWAEHPSGGASLIGGNGTYDKDGGYDASLVVIGGAIYMPPPRGQNAQSASDAAALLRKVVASLAAKPYGSGIFVDTDRFGEIPGALPLSDINLSGSAKTPRPAAIMNMRSFSTDAANPFMTGVEISDTSERQGQGQHGSFGRHDTFNCMLAFGPDFKTKLEDADPVSNADIAITLSHLLGIDLSKIAKGKLTGRIIDEALANGPAPRGSKRLQNTSVPTEQGTTTILQYQIYTDASGAQFRYFDAAGFPGVTVGLEKK